MNFLSDDFKKYLAEYYVYDAWQFIVNTDKSINIARYCYDLINKFTKQMDNEHKDWKNELYKNSIKQVQKSEIVQIEINENDLPKYNLDILGINRFLSFSYRQDSKRFLPIYKKCI